jgi:hypothetical protein
VAKGGPKRKVDPTFALIGQTLDNLAAMIEIGLLTFNKKRGPGRPTDSRLERTLQSAKAEYDTLRKPGLLLGIAEGVPEFKPVSRQEALDIVVKNNNGYVDKVKRYRQELPQSDRGLQLPISVCRITGGQLEAQLEGKRPSARRYATRHQKKPRPK